MSTTTETRSLPQRFVVKGEWDEITVVETRSTAFSFTPGWRPAVNAFRCAGRFVIFAELAGVAPDAVTVAVEPFRVTLRGRRPAVEPGCDRSELAQVLALEIDQGVFERTLELPQEVDANDLSTEYRDGVLRIELPLKA